MVGATRGSRGCRVPSGLFFLLDVEDVRSGAISRRFPSVVDGDRLRAEPLLGEVDAIDEYGDHAERKRCADQEEDEVLIHGIADRQSTASLMGSPGVKGYRAAVGFQHLDADVVGVGIVMSLHPSENIIECAPSNDGIHDAVVSVCDRLLGVAEADEVVRMVRQRIL